jgi:hypothetical protein
MMGIWGIFVINKLNIFFMKELKIVLPNATHKRKVAENWDELTTPQYLKVCEVFMINWGGVGIFPENVVSVMRQQLLYIITDTDNVFWENIRKAYLKEYGGDDTFMALLRDMLQLTDFMFKKRANTEGVVTYEAHVTRTVNPYPSIYFDAQKMIREYTIAGNKAKTTQLKREYEKTVRELKTLFGKTKEVVYFAPADGLDNISFYEMCALFQVYEKYVTNGAKDIHLCELIATMYRPKKGWTEHNQVTDYEGDKRIAYEGSEGTVDSRTQKCKLIHKAVKWGLLFWFVGCRTAIFENPRFRVLFEGKGSDDPLKLGMFKVLFALQDSESYNSETARRENGLFALTYLSNKIMEGKNE